MRLFRLFSGIQRCCSPAGKRSRSPTRLSSESLERRYALDAATPDAGGHYAADASDGEALRFFLSESGIGEQLAAENPTIHMELGETKTLYIWMQVPAGMGMYSVAIDVVSATGGIISPIESSIYEPEVGERWMAAAPPSGEAGTSGDILTQLAPFTISPPSFGRLAKLYDPSYDVDTGAFLFGSVTVSANNFGRSDLFMNVGWFKTVARDFEVVPVRFGIGDAALRGNDVFAASALPDAVIVVDGPADSVPTTVDAYDFVVRTETVVDVSASAGVLSNDGASAEATVELVAPPRFGSIELNADGSFRYVSPSAERLYSALFRHWRERIGKDWAGHWNLDDAFTYRIITPGGESAVTRSSIQLTADLGVSDGHFTIDTRLRSAVELQGRPFMNDLSFAEDGSETTFRIIAGPQHGNVEVRNGIWIYEPDFYFVGHDQFTYERIDGESIATATIYFDMTYSNRPPLALDDAFEVAEPTRVLQLRDLLANDDDPDGDSMIVTDIRITQLPQHGTLVLGFESLIYTPLPGFNGDDTFKYVVKDRHDESLAATVTLNVSASWSPPNGGDEPSDGGPVAEPTPPAAAPTPIPAPFEIAPVEPNPIPVELPPDGVLIGFPVDPNIPYVIGFPFPQLRPVDWVGHEAPHILPHVDHQEFQQVVFHHGNGQFLGNDAAQIPLEIAANVPAEVAAEPALPAVARRRVSRAIAEGVAAAAADHHFAAADLSAGTRAERRAMRRVRRGA